MDECDNDYPMGEAIEAFAEAWPSFKEWWTSKDAPYGGKFSVEEIPPEPFSAFLATAPCSDAMLAAGALKLMEWFTDCKPEEIKASAHMVASSIYDAMCERARD